MIDLKMLLFLLEIGKKRAENFKNRNNKKKSKEEREKRK